MRPLATLFSALFFLAQAARGQDTEELKARIVDQLAENQIRQMILRRYERARELQTQCGSIAGGLGATMKTLQTSQKSVNPRSMVDLEQALADVTVLSIGESRARSEILIRAAELRSTQTLASNLLSQLSLSPDQVAYLNQTHREGIEFYGYRERLWSHYKRYTGEHGPVLRRALNPCVSIGVDVAEILQTRRARINEAFQKIGNAYTAALRANVEQEISSVLGPATVASEVRSVLNRLDSEYRRAFLLRSDFFGGTALVSRYENIGRAILAVTLPAEVSLEAREAALSELRQKMRLAAETQEAAERDPPSVWVARRLSRLKRNYEEGRFNCDASCRKDLQYAELLGAAAAVMEDVTSSKTHAAIASDLLNRAEK